MSFVKGFKFDIFISYAHVDDALSTGAILGWVEAFVQELRVQLAQKIGRADLIAIWKDDEQLPGNVPLTPEIVEKLRKSALLVSILSRGYLSSDWCGRELRTFCELDSKATAADRSRVFMIERVHIPRMERPPELADLHGFKFWDVDRHAMERTLSLIPPAFQPDGFHQAMGQLVNDLAVKLKQMNEDAARPMTSAAMSKARLKPAALENVVEEMALRITPLDEKERAPELSDGLFVGVGDFDQRSYLPRLRHATDDAVALAHLFAIDLQLIAPARVRLALGGETHTLESAVRLAALERAGARRFPATRTELMLALHEIEGSRKAAGGGLLVTAFSSHGYEEDGTVYLMPADGVRRYTRETGLPLPMLQHSLQEARAQTKLLILDACRSPEEGGKKGAEAMTLDFERALKETEGLAVLCSCGAGQSSWESQNLGLGVFTHFLRDGLLGAATARAEDGVISLDAVFAYAMANTNQFVRKNINVEQLPWCGNRAMVAGLPLALSREVAERSQELKARQQNLETRKEIALRHLFEARRAHRGLIEAQLEQVERELDLLTGEPLDELLENLEKLADRKASSCRLFSAWWTNEHTAPALHVASPPDGRRPWMNSLGMNFVPVGDVLFAVCLTRVQDFKEFALSTGYKAVGGDFFVLQNGKWTKGDFSWTNPNFRQGSSHPVVGVNWADAQAFCAWLGERERAAGILGPNESYELPGDQVWSEAVGPTRFPWGDEWPPPTHAGNYAVATATAGESRAPGTTPVGTFPPNARGISDLGGNAWEWSNDWYRKDMNAENLRAEFDFLNDDGGGRAYRFLRGGSWFNSIPRDLLSGYRNPGKYPDARFANVGFRVVLRAGQEAEVAAFHP